MLRLTQSSASRQRRINESSVKLEVTDVDRRKQNILALARQACCTLDSIRDRGHFMEWRNESSDGSRTE